MGLVEITPLMDEICFNNADEDTKNFIVFYLGLAFKIDQKLSYKLLDFVLPTKLKINLQIYTL
jgi:hypothetical protein